MSEHLAELERQKWKAQEVLEWIRVHDDVDVHLYFGNGYMSRHTIIEMHTHEIPEKRIKHAFKDEDIKQIGIIFALNIVYDEFTRYRKGPAIRLVEE